ncbi:STAS/SEC14 domain-containing protein [Mesorhizobium sp. CC13]|uniref:STAS/SEC14 domain-containing protein n=1 Tax=Mesorhizobium sp. CC13 TaxID=3029194 RepID=UPI0032671E0C
MASMDIRPAVRRIETDRNDVLGFEIVGRFTPADYENTYGLLDAAYRGQDKIDILVRAEGYEGFDWSPIFSSSTWKEEFKAFKHIRRYALVGGPAWIGAMMRFFAPLSPIEIRYFPPADEAKAWAWLGARPIEPRI